MAEEGENQDTAESAGQESGGGLKRHLWIFITAGVVAAAVGAGLGLGRLLSGPQHADAAAPQEETTYQIDTRTEGEAGEYEYVEFAPIIVNLDEPRLTRYIRAKITLAIERTGEWKKARELIDRKKPELKNWLNLFFAGRTLDDVRGEKKLNRVRREIQDSMNDRLWPNGKPMIDHVLLMECAVQ